MYKDSKLKINYKDIDYEIRDLIRYMNEFDGIETVESCFGHNEEPCRIWFKAESIKAIVDFSFRLFDCQDIWKIEIDTGDINRDWDDLHFLLYSSNYKDFPTVNLMVDNLTYRMKEEIERMKNET